MAAEMNSPAAAFKRSAREMGLYQWAEQLAMTRTLAAKLPTIPRGSTPPSPTPYNSARFLLSKQTAFTATEAEIGMELGSTDRLRTRPSGRSHSMAKSATSLFRRNNP